MTIRRTLSAQQIPVAKLTRPVVNPAHLVRAGLVERVCASAGIKLVLVHAPAGFGKSTLMGQLHQAFAERGKLTGWLNLDSSDNDPSRFLSCLSALARPWVSTQDAREPSGTRAIDKAARQVLDQLCGQTCPYVIFLDEFNVIKDATVLGLVRELVDQLPPEARLVIGTRTTPDLPLGRWRARGQLLEVNEGHLKLTLDETSTMLAGLQKLNLSQDNLLLLHQRTEGWVTGLWLAAIALQRQSNQSDFIGRFSGSHNTIASYLAESVLKCQPAEVQRFLLRTSVARQLCEPLCRFLVPELDCKALLGKLEHTDVLLIRASNDEEWYRYHNVFLDFLRSQLEKECPQEVARLHRAASQWYLSQDRPVPAIDHAIAGGDLEHAAEVLSVHGPHLVSQGRMRLLTRWLESLSADLLCRHPILQVIHLWAIAFTRGAENATALMRHYGLEKTEDPKLRAFILPLRPMLLAMMDRVPQALAEAKECVARLPTASPLADAMLLTMAASLHVNASDFTGARDQLEAARRTQGGKPDGFAAVFSESIEGLIDAVQGRLVSGRVHLRMAEMIGRSHRSTEGISNAWAGVLHATALYESDDLDGAERSMRAYAPVCGTLGLADLMILVHLVLGRIAFRRGDVDRTFQSLTELEYLGRQFNLTRVIVTAKLERGRVLLHQGHVQAAREQLDRAEDDALWERVAQMRTLGNEIEDLAYGRMRWEVTAGAADAALPRLEAAITQAEKEARNLRVLKLRFLQALARWRCGQRRSSHELLTSILKQCHSDGFFNSILEEGPLAGLALSDLASEVAKGNPNRADAGLAAYLQRLLVAFGLLPVERSSAKRGTPAPLQPLTHKELAVLRLVADGCSDAIVAEKLCLSIFTVRTHLRNLYIKLNVHSRMQAVHSARLAGIF